MDLQDADLAIIDLQDDTTFGGHRGGKTPGGTAGANVETNGSGPIHTGVAPVVTGGDPLVVWTEGSNTASTPVTIAPGFTVTDADSPQLQHVTITLSNFDANDRLALANNPATMGDIVGHYDPSTGILDIGSSSGTGTPAQYQAAVRAATFTNISDAPSPVHRDLTVTAFDFSGNSASTSLSGGVDIVEGPDKPVLFDPGGFTTFFEPANATPTGVVAAPGLTVTDPDQGILTGATVQITGFYISGEDQLLFTDQSGITGSFNSSNGTLTLSGFATASQYQAALESVKYNDTSDTPLNFTRVLTYVVSHGGMSSDPVTRMVAVQQTNDAPTLSGIGFSPAVFIEGAGFPSNPVAVADTIGVTDPDSVFMSSATVAITSHFHAGEDVLSAGSIFGLSSSYDAATGVLTLSGLAAPSTYQAFLRTVTYTNSSDTPSPETRTVTVTLFDANNPNSTSNTQTRDIIVLPTNDPPSGADAVLSGTEDTPRTFALADFGYSDPENNLFTGVRITTLPAQGAITLDGAAVSAGQVVAAADITAGKLVFVPVADAAGSTGAFTFQAQDDGGGQNEDQSPNTLSFTLAAVNDPPVLTAGGTTAFTEAAGAGVASTPVAVATGLTLSDVDSSTFQSAAVTIGAGFHAGEDLLAFANDGSTMGDITAVYTPGTGSLALTSAGGAATTAQWQAALRAVTYADSSDNPSTAARTIGFTIHDDHGLTSAVANQMVTVTAVNDPPAGSDQSLTIQQDTSLVLHAASFGFSDPEGGALLSVKIDTLPGHGVLADHGVAVTAGQVVSAADLSGGFLTFAPAAGQSGAAYAHFTFQVQDNGGTANGGLDLDASPNTLTINVDPPPAPPTSPGPPVIVSPPAGSGGLPPAGTAGDDVAILGNGGVTFSAGAGADSVSSGSGDDSLSGGDGNDTLDGGGGANTVMGGAGDDVITIAGAGSNYLRGDEGGDHITGGGGFDDINGNMGDDDLHGGGGDDWVVGGKDNDRVAGDAGNDIVYGNLGNDICDGGDGNDLIRGGQGSDTLFGDAGNDFLSGDRGDDTVTGGAGADTFHTSADVGMDVVTDFSLAQGDKVMLDPGTVYTVAQVGADTVITMTGGEMILQNVQLSTLTPGWIFGA